MTRESRARWLAAATTALVVLLAALFALLHNLPGSPAPATAAAPAPLPDPARVAAGERAYARLGCAMCHSIGGRGNPGSPLDGIGARLERRALYEMTTGTGAAAAQLGAGLARRKQRAVGDPDMDALLDYLAQLR